MSVTDRLMRNNIHSSLAQSVERMTVNHDVAGSSPAGGAKNPDCESVRDFIFGALRRGNKPPVLPGEEKIL